MHLLSDRHGGGALRALALGCALGLIAAAPAAATPFGPDSVWEAPLASGAAPAPNSGALVAELHRQVAGPGGAWINTTHFSAPVYTVGRTQPDVRVTLDTHAPPLQADFEQVPVPDDAVPSPDSDGNLVIYQPLTDTLWELWRARKASDGWHAAWGGKMENASRNPGHFENPFGASATSLALVGGQITIAEMRAGRIDHALAVSIPQTRHGEFVWPAQRTDGVATSAGAIPAGTRFRLDPELDLGSLTLSRSARIIAEALQKYGMIVRDQAGAVTLFGEDPAPHGEGDPWPELLGDWPHYVMGSLPWGHFQAVVPDQTVFRERLVLPPTIPGVQTSPPSVGLVPTPVASPPVEPPTTGAPPAASAAAAPAPNAKARANVIAKATQAQAQAARICAKARGKRASATAKRRCRAAVKRAARTRRTVRTVAPR